MAKSVPRGGWNDYPRKPEKGETESLPETGYGVSLSLTEKAETGAGGLCEGESFRGG